MRPSQGAPANRRPTEQSDRSGHVPATVAADRAFWAPVAELTRSVKHDSLPLPRRTSGSPEGARDDSPGQASLRASVALGSRHPGIPEPWWGGTGTPASRARWPSPGVPAFFRPVGAPGDSRGFITQGGVPRRLGTAHSGLALGYPLSPRWGWGPRTRRQPMLGERFGSNRTPSVRHGFAVRRHQASHEDNPCIAIGGSTKP